jgi:hypothetical protein
MAGAAKKTVIQDAVIEEIELDPSEMMELDKIAEETRRRGVSWEEKIVISRYGQTGQAVF